MRMSYNQYQALFFACRSVLAKNRPGNEAKTHIDLNKAHACPGQQQVILFKLSSVFFFKAVFPSSDTV